MSRLVQIAVQEYKRNVIRRSFIITLFSVPLILGLALGSGMLLENLVSDDQPVGIVDQIGFITSASIPGVERDRISFILYEDEVQAKQALEGEEIQAYLLISPQYLENRKVELVYLNRVGENIYGDIVDLFRYNLVANQPPQVVARVVEGTSLLVRSLDGGREIDPQKPTFDILLPLFISFALVYMLMISAGYLMAAVAEEKENRTIEVIITSVSHNQFMGGKVLGILAISLTLLLTWSAVALGCILLARAAGVEWFTLVNPNWRSLISVVIIGLPTYVLAAALMAAVGSVVNSVQEGQSLAGLFVMLHMIPIYTIGLMIEEPDSTVVTVLSLTPFTSLLGSTMRQVFGYMPDWQIALAAGVQTILALAAIWFAGKAFRMGMLQYGQRLKLKRIFQGWGKAGGRGRSNAKEAVG